MKTRRLLLSGVIACLLLSACDQIMPASTIDSASDESFEQSSSKVREKLTAEEKVEFDKALMSLTMEGMDTSSLLGMNMDMSSLLSPSELADFREKLRSPLDGLTGEEIISRGRTIELEREALKKKHALEEIKELELEKAAADEAREKLKLFEIKRSRFYVEKDRFRDKPVIELTVKNGTGLAISRAYFEGTVSSPNRSIPWIKESFNYTVAGGVEPDEEASWSLAPNSFSNWGRVTVPEDAVFTVTVAKLDGADGESIFDASGFTERKARRLTELKTRHQPQ